MDLSWRFDRWWEELPASPTDLGTVEGLVLRPPGGGTGARELVGSVRVSLEAGSEGDRWSEDEERLGADHVSLVNVHVLSSVAGEDPDRRAQSGDNLQVDLDLTEENLPVGSLLEIGTAVLEVSPQPHQPCAKFHDRYGELAVKRVLRANRRGRRGRGVLCTVRQAGAIRVGDEIRVRRP